LKTEQFKELDNQQETSLAGGYFCLFFSSIGSGALDTYLAICWEPYPANFLFKLRIWWSGQSAGNLLAKKGGLLRDYTPEPAVRTAFPLSQNWKGTWDTILPAAAYVCCSRVNRRRRSYYCSF